MSNGSLGFYLFVVVAAFAGLDVPFKWLLGWLTRFARSA